jgi:alkylation response protein AidB-like acyl-CoA dehydrogenase
MDFRLTEEQMAFQEAARIFAEKEMTPYAQKWDEECIFPIETLRKAAELGFAGLYVSPPYGGCGLGRLEGSLVFEELSNACVSTAAYLSIHNMVSWMIEAFGESRAAPEMASSADHHGIHSQATA